MRVVSNSATDDDGRASADDFGHEHDRTCRDHDGDSAGLFSGAAAWSPDEGQTWFKLPQARAVIGRSLLRILKPDGSSATTARFEDQLLQRGVDSRP
jgi:hypothetical protein